MCDCGSLPGHDECSICRTPDEAKPEPVVLVPVPPCSAAGEEPL